MTVGWRWLRDRCGLVDAAVDHLYRAGLAADLQEWWAGAAGRADIRGPGGSRFLRLVAWKAVVWAMLSLVAEDCVLGLSRDWESIDGPARVEGAIDLEAAAVCRSRAERAVDAIFAQAVRRVAITIDGGGCGLGLGVVASTGRA